MSALKRLGLDPSEVAEQKQTTEAQNQTKEAFAFKWAKRDTYESDNLKTHSKRWLFERYCGDNPDRLAEWLSGSRKIILDAGCGSGYSALLFFGDYLKDHDYLGVDISNAIDTTRVRFREAGYAGDFLKANFLDLTIPDESVDIIFSEGVLHHTDSVAAAIKFLTKKLKKGGRFLFYVYKKKGPIREFADDYIRNYLKGMDNGEAWKALIPLTKLGKALGDLNIKINVPEEVAFLEIPAGEIDIQRLFYWHVFKAFYKPDLTIDEMNHINFDWYRPLNCHRHTPDEIRQWCLEAGLNIEHMDVQEAGITVVSLK